MRSRIVMWIPFLLLAFACAESGGGGGGDPVGTFCVLVEGTGSETCLEQESIHAYRTETSGKVWFDVQGTVDVPVEDTYSGVRSLVPRLVRIFGELPVGVDLPRGAENVLVEIPVSGSCTRTVQVNPFGACDTLTRISACRAQSIYRPDLTVVTVEHLSETDVVLTFTSMVAFEDFSLCCADEEGWCDVATPSSFTPAGPFAISGRVHVAFPE